ncbi:toll-like receptor, partial [Penaeus vannamei]
MNLSSRDSMPDASLSRNLTKLQHLNLSENYITTLYNDSLVGLVNLISLDLSNNKLKGINRMGRSGVSSSAVRTDSLSPRVRAPSPLIPWLSSIRRNARAVGPLGWQGKDLPRTTIAAYAFSDLVRLRTLNLSENMIMLLPPELFHNLTNLLILDISYNRLMTWDDPVLGSIPNLTELHLRTNLLDGITDAMEVDFRKESLKLVDLQDNTFKCDCSLSKFNRSLNTSNFLNWPYLCREGKRRGHGEYIARAPCNFATQPENHGRMRAIVISTIVSSLLLVASVMVYRKRWYVRYFMYTVRMRTKVVREEADKYLYDTFVCYSQTDRQWVFEHLVAKLEDGGRYRVCIHERDFTVGQEITDNIISSVERS